MGGQVSAGAGGTMGTTRAGASSLLRQGPEVGSLGQVTGPGLWGEAGTVLAVADPSRGQGRWPRSGRPSGELGTGRRLGPQDPHILGLSPEGRLRDHQDLSGEVRRVGVGRAMGGETDRDRQGHRETLRQRDRWGERGTEAKPTSHPWARLLAVPPPSTPVPPHLPGSHLP